MMPLLTCKDFLKELSAYLDNDVDPELKADLQKHVSECPNCWVVCDTTEKTVKIYKGMEPQPLPSSVQGRLLDFLARKCKGKPKGLGCGEQSEKQTAPPLKEV